jgi:ATP-dependent RNA helicase DeaD
MKDFLEFNLPPQILQSLARMNITVPTPVQSASLPIAMTGSDLLASAQTGTGKTLAYAIPLAAHIMGNPKASALILAPTRELATQVLATIKSLLSGNIQCNTALLIGGDSMPMQVSQLRNRPRVIVGTPGRINDHLLRGNLNLHQTNFLVIDEADRMLDMGFSIQLDKIAHYLPKARQTLMFSATMPANIMKLSKEYLQNPQFVAVDSTTQAAPKITQEVIHTSANDKFTKLLNELDKREGSIIVFVKTKRNAEQLANQLNLENHNADAIHGDLNQRRRDRVIISFRSRKIRILVATDIAARGLDIPDVMHVINYHLPQCPEDYIHRIGRTARAGTEGNALCLISPDDRSKWKIIHRLMYPGQQVPEAPFDRDEPRGESRPPQRARFGAANNDANRVGKPGASRFRPKFGEKSFKENGPRREGKPAARSEFSDRPARADAPRRDDSARPARPDSARPHAAKPARPGAGGKPDYAKKSSSRPSFGKPAANSSFKPARPFSRSSSRPSTRAS